MHEHFRRIELERTFLKENVSTNQNIFQTGSILLTVKFKRWLDLNFVAWRYLRAHFPVAWKVNDSKIYSQKFETPLLLPGKQILLAMTSWKYLNNQLSTLMEKFDVIV